MTPTPLATADRPATLVDRMLDTPVVPADVLAPSALTLLLFAGSLKDLPFLAALPVDLTLLGAVLVGLLIAVELVRSSFALPPGVGAVVGLWTTFLLGVFLAGDTDYSTTKVERLFTLTLLSALGALFLLRTPRRQVVWLWSLVLVGAVVLLTTLVAPDQTLLEAGRLAAEGSNTIATGRVAGAAAIILAVGAATKLVPRVLGTLGVVLCVAAMIATGSRGPLVAAIVAIVVVVLLRPGTFVARTRRLVLSALAIVLGGAAIVTYGSSGAGFTRIAALLGGTQDDSTDARVYLAQQSLRVLASDPLGIGWGDLPSRLPDSGFGDSAIQLKYAHDLLLEVGVESGWIAGLALIAFIVVALIRLKRASGGPLGATMLAVTVFFLVNALVSGDVNDNRMAFAALAVAWVVPLATAPAAPEDDGDVVPSADRSQAISTAGASRRASRQQVTKSAV